VSGSPGLERLARERVRRAGQPLVYNGVLYTANVKRVVAIDVATGRQL